MTKMTKMQKFEMLANLAEVKASDVLSEFVAREIELLKQKNTNRKPTEKQTANKAIQEAILDALESGEKYTITELLKVVKNLPKDMTNQRMSALVRPLVAAKVVERVEEKRKAYFRLPIA